MLNFLFKKKEEVRDDIKLSEIYFKLKEIYDFENISDERKKSLTKIMEDNQYLPYSQIQALEELSDAEVLFSLETKWKINKIFDGEKFNFSKTSVLERNSCKNSNWIKKEGHNIKLINLSALGNGNKTEEAGKFMDWMRQLLILPSGNLNRGIFSTTIYLIPFFEREFGCAYLPKSNDISSLLEDKKIKEQIGLDAKEQVKTFIKFAQLAGHPVIYDVLPQTGRFAKMVLANPFIARWFDINHLLEKYEQNIEIIASKLEKKYEKEDVEVIKDICKQTLKSGAGDLTEHYKAIYEDFEEELCQIKKTICEDMSKFENQTKLQKRVKEIVCEINEIKTNKQFEEKDLANYVEAAQALIKNGFWTAPGGAWCSCGIPVFDKMSECGSYPVFKHYDYKCNDVTNFANLDCQTPFYFTLLETGKENKPVTDFYIHYLTKLQEEYNFDGFRFDHVDHIIDEVSQQNGKSISYRIPKEVLAKVNSSIKNKIPYFATMAEYMLGGNLLKEYHEEMFFDVLWGNDIIAQNDKTPEKIVEDNHELAAYNQKNFNTENLAILKTYNNQDGEFRFIDRYPGQLSAEGALFKWFKYKFLPGGKNAQRPIMYVDGDETYTKTGIERTIGNEVSMLRAKNYDFFKKFDAINRLALSQEIVTEGEAQIIQQDEEGFACWIISKEPIKTSFLIVANYNYPTEQITIEDEFCTRTEIKQGDEVCDKKVCLPGDYELTSEFVFDGENFVEKTVNNDEIFKEHTLIFDKLEPSEFRIFLLKK